MGRLDRGIMSDWDSPVPCASNPEAWFGYDSDRGRRTPEQVRDIERAKLLCTRECPLSRQRQCARDALANDERYGIWAGVELVIRKTTSAKEMHSLLRVGREQLRAIAAG